MTHLDIVHTTVPEYYCMKLAIGRTIAEPAHTASFHMVV